VRCAGRARGGRRPAVPGGAPPQRLAFTAVGTAVRPAGAAHGQRAPFTCDVSGQDFAKLITARWVPAGLALGISIGSRHDDRELAGQARWWSGNGEVTGWTELVNRSRHDARRRLEQDVRRLGGEGVVITSMQMRVRERDCPTTVGRRDHIAEVTLTGTAIARFSRAGQCPAGPALTVWRAAGSAARQLRPGYSRHQLDMTIAADHGSSTQGQLAFDAGAQPLSAERRAPITRLVPRGRDAAPGGISSSSVRILSSGAHSHPLQVRARSTRRRLRVPWWVSQLVAPPVWCSPWRSARPGRRVVLARLRCRRGAGCG
jgi:uncharacterized protein YbjQ (UPF0145 family)